MRDPLRLFTFFSASLLVATPAFAQTGNETSGTDAGTSITTGDFNALFGDRAGSALTNESDNTHIGYAAGRFNSASDNTYVGWAAGAGTTDPTGATAVAAGNITGFDLVCIGHEAGLVNTTAGDNTFIGSEAGEDNTTGIDNTFVGEEAGSSNIDGDENTFIGEDAGFSHEVGDSNTAVGNEAFGFGGDVGSTGNTAIGNEAGSDIDGGDGNTMVGSAAGGDVGSGSCNTFLGSNAGHNTEHGDYNTFVGFAAGWDNNRTNNQNNADRNTYLGFAAGMTNREGENNVVIGAFSDFSDVLDNSTTADVCDDHAVFGGGDPDRSGGDNNVSNVVALGADIDVRGDGGIIIGFDGELTGSATDAIAIGNGVSASHTNSISIGTGTASRAANTVVIGNAATVAWEPHTDGVTTLGSASFRYGNLHTAQANLLAGSGTSADLTLSADAGTDADDVWRLSAENSGGLVVSSFSTGAFSSLLTVQNTGDVTIAGDLTLNSDARLKTDIEPLSGALDQVTALQGRQYRWRPDLQRGDAQHIGFVAQEVQKVAPDLVKASSDGTLTVNYLGVVPLLVDAVTELREQVDTLAADNARLRRKLGE